MKKTQMIIVVILIAMISCRSYRDKSRLENHRNTLSENRRNFRYGFEQTGKDSLERAWYFWTDSILSFHPDDGLRSMGGNLSVSERRVGLRQVQIDVDSLGEEQHTEVIYNRDEQSKTWYHHPWWIAGLALLGFTQVYLISRLLAGKRKNP